MPKIVDHQQRREILAEVAAITIANIGLENTTIREIARQSGYSKGIIEHYFDSKEDLIASALAWINRRYQLRVAQKIGQRQGLAALRIRLEETLPLCEQSIQEWKVRLRFWSLAAIDTHFQEVHSTRWQAARDAFSGDLQRARELGEVSDNLQPVDATDRILFFTSGISAAALHSPGSISQNQLNQWVDECLSQLTAAQDS